MNTSRFVCLAALAAGSLCRGQAIISTVAGTGTGGFSGDNGLAINARISGGPGSGANLSLAIDNAGNLLIVDGGNGRVRKVNAAGTIATIAGGGGSAGNGDGGLATKAQLFPSGVTTDAAGNIYVSEGGDVRKINASGVINTIAGTGFGGPSSGDGGPALSATFFATSVAIDAAGNLYIADSLNNRIRKVTGAGTISTVAGTGTGGFSGDGGPAISSGMGPTWVTMDTAGNLYIADSLNRKIRKVNSAGVISTLAGTLNTGQGNGDGGPAASAVFVNPTALTADAAGNVYIADVGDARIRKASSGAAAPPITVSPTALSFSYTIGAAQAPSQTVVIATPGTTLTYTATTSTTTQPNWLSVSPASGIANATLTLSVSPTGLAAGTYTGTVIITPSGSGNTPLTVPVTLNVNAPVTQGVISTVAGNGNVIFASEGGSATSAALSVIGLALDSSGSIYIGDYIDSKILKVSGGTVTTFAGNGAITYAGDGGPALRGSFFNPFGVAVDKSGNVYIADENNNRVRKVDAAGNISTVAGNGQPGATGDGGAATSAAITNPMAVAVDSAGNLYIADSGNNRIRKVTTAGVISTVAGGAPLVGFSGDGGPAMGAGLFLPGGLAVDSAGNLYIADVANNRVRKVTAGGTIGTVAGNGGKSFSGDGGPATAASLNLTSSHAGLAVDSFGSLYIPDAGNHRVRKVDTAGIISTVAGNGIGGFSGDGGPATNAGLNNPNDLAVDSAGNLYIADGSNNRVRKVTISQGGAAPTIAANGIVNGASFQPAIVPNSWATITGNSLAPVTDTWDKSIVNGKLPTSLDGVTVTIGGKAAYPNYISPTQINLVVPDIAAGSTQVTVSTPSGTSSTFTVTANAFGPAFFAWPNSQPVATRQDFGFAVKNGTFSGLTTTPAKPGDVIILWGTGFGPTSPAPAAGAQVPADRTYSTSTLPLIMINGVRATVFGAALAPGFVGLYQVAIQVPSSLEDGDWPVVASIGGAASPAGVLLSVRR